MRKPAAAASEHRSVELPRRLALRAALIALIAGGGLLSSAQPACADDGQSGATALLEPTLGSAVDSLHLLGATGDETWGYGTLRGVPAVEGDQQTPATIQAANPGPVAFVRYRPGAGWRAVDEPRDADGTPMPAFRPLGVFPGSPSALGGGDIDRFGNASILGAIISPGADGKPAYEERLLLRAPGGQFRLVASPRAAANANALFADGVAPLLVAPDAIGRAERQAVTADEATTVPAEEAQPTTPGASSDAAAIEPAGTTPEPVATTPAEPIGAPAPAAPPIDVPTGQTPETNDRTLVPAPSATATATEAGAVIAPAPATPRAAVDDAKSCFPAAPVGNDPHRMLDAEHLYLDGINSRQAAMVVQEPGGGPGALVGALRRTTNPALPAPTEASVFHFNGVRWRRECIVLPTALVPGFQIVAMAGTGLDDAWLLARAGATAATGRGLLLFGRDMDGVWRQRPLGATYSTARPVAGVTNLTPLGQSADPLTVTPNGLWIDASFMHGGITYSSTVYVDKTAAAVTGSWCDAPVASLCMRALGARFDLTAGYKSFGWGGVGPYGQRVITNAIRPAGATSRGARLTLQGTSFVRVRGLGRGGGDAAFSEPNDGWLTTPTDNAESPLVHVTDAPAGSRLQSWPVPARTPLLALASEPGREPGATASQAVAVGLDGTVARYVPGDGWRPEYLQNQDGVRQKPSLRAVAWPEANRAHAVGSDGAMWVWRSATGLWESDASKPLDFFGHLMGVAFQPGDPSRGYAVGLQGTILKYGKTWTQEELPAAVKDLDITSVAFAGARAYAVYRDPSFTVKSGLLVNDGAGWQIDDDAARTLAGSVDAKLFSVGGLPDGSAVAGGNGIVMQREGPSSGWKLASSPPVGLTAFATKPFRQDGALRAAIAVSAPVSLGPGLRSSTYPPPTAAQPPSLPGESPQLLDEVPPPLVGIVLRQGATGGWLDEQHELLPEGAAGRDTPVDSDFVYAFELNASGTQGWAVGGRVNRTDDEVDAPADNARRRSAAAFRYPGDPNVVPPVGRTGVPVDTKRVRLAFGGHASCAEACADDAKLGLAADVGLQAAVTAAGALRGQAYGPRAFVYSGPRIETGSLDGPEAARFADLASSASNAATLPFYAAPGPDAAAVGAGAYRAAFKDFPAPFGQGSTPFGVTPVSATPDAAGDQSAKNHYAFDSAGAAGTVRVIVIDNSAGSLAASDPSNVPSDPSQEAWLIRMLNEAKERKVPAIVVGNRDLNSLAAAGSNVATDAPRIAQLLVDHGASAYLHDAPGVNRAVRIPARADRQIPQFGTGTLGYASAPPVAASIPYYGESGYLLVEIDADQTDPATNVAPVGARLIPVLAELSLDPTDGVLLRRSQTSAYLGLGRRARMGGIDPYQQYPPVTCQRVACPGRIPPEFSFTSSRPDIASFVQQDTRSTNDHAIRLGADSRPIPDATSGLLCAYNSGKTDISVHAGGLTYTQTVTVQGGAVGSPCGTQPLTNPPTQPGTSEDVATVAPRESPDPSPSPSEAIPITIPAPPAALTPPVAAVAKPALPKPAPAAESVPVKATVIPLLPIIPGIVPPSIARPLPPPGITGVSQPVVEEKREEEEATESSSAFSVALPQGELRQIGGGLVALILLAAGGGAVVRSRRRPGMKIARATTRKNPQHRPHDGPSRRSRKW